MDANFLNHNRHLESNDRFQELDPNLSYLAALPYPYLFPLVRELPLTEPGIYTLGGGRQIGKTTLLKQWMYHLLQLGKNPTTIRFLTGDIIDDYHSLIHIFQRLYEELPQDQLLYIILDEVTYIKEWDRGIKYLADTGLFSKTVLILTGSDLTFLKEARMRFPGRRGKSDRLDYHLYPLSFQETRILKGEIDFDSLYQSLQNYLLHGGYLTAINDIGRYQLIKHGTLQTYSDWIRGDSLKRGKNEAYLKEIFMAILKTYGTQVTWNALAQHTSIHHPSTVQEYCDILQSMEAVFIQSALIEDKLLPAPKKARKLVFCDPFIFHSIRNWITGKLPTQIGLFEPVLVETVLINHVRRSFPTYYIKAEGEVDIAYIRDGKFWPIEIKWTNQLRSKDLKQILKYKNHLIVTKHQEPSTEIIHSQWIFDFLEQYAL